MGNLGNFEKSASGLLLPSTSYKPFRYPWAYDFWQKQQQVHWMPEEVPLGEDLKDWSINLTEVEKNLLTQIFRFFTQSDVCLLYTSPSPRDLSTSRMPSSA